MMVRIICCFIFLNFYLSPGFLSAEQQPLVFEEAGITAKIEADQADETSSVTFQLTSNRHEKVSVFSVPDPARIVIDLHGIKLKKNKTHKLNNFPLVTAIRFGYHDNKIRNVLDLSSSSLPPYRWSQSNELITLTLESPAAAKPVEPSSIRPVPAPISEDSDRIEDLIQIKKQPTQAPPTATPSPVEPTATRTPLATEAPTAIATMQPTPEIQEVIEEEILEGSRHIKDETSSLIKGSSARLELTNISFNYMPENKKPYIRLVLSNKSEFEFQKFDIKTYILKINAAQIRKAELLLPHFPPHDFVGFTLLHAEKNNGNIDIKIGTERNRRISATPRDNEIWITIAEDEKIETKSLPGMLSR